MKKIGIIGGMSWESTVHYYTMLNQGVKAALGGLASADIVMRSVNFKPIEEMQRAGQWEDLGDLLANEAYQLQQNGAELMVLATNTMHKVAPAIEAAIDVPFVHIADATADAIAQDDLKVVGLYGTAYTMEQDFYKQRLVDRGIKVIVPTKEERPIINTVIFDELCQGRRRPSSRKAFIDAGYLMMQRGAQGLVLGCTEINMLINAKDFTIPVFDTTTIHVNKVVQLALGT